VENTRAAQTQGALTTQYQTQTGAVATWQGQVNQAANVQADIAGKAATESTGMLNEATKLRLDGAITALQKARLGGLEAAEYHRIAQIIGQVSHDIARRVEEMGQYRF
jgi:hypothetical protein